MMPRRFTIIGDGPTDRALVPIVNWVLCQIPSYANKGFVVDFTAARGPDGLSLQSRLPVALHDFPSDVFFVHRDAERESLDTRIAEIEAAVQMLRDRFVPLVPVRMTEAWLLIDVAAIRRAADNPNGTVPLPIPPLARLESLPDPKETCNSLLIQASEKSGRRRERFNRPSELGFRRIRIAGLINDFSPLKQLPAFCTFCDRVQAACQGL